MTKLAEKRSEKPLHPSEASEHGNHGAPDEEASIESHTRRITPEESTSLVVGAAYRAFNLSIKAAAVSGGLSDGASGAGDGGDGGESSGGDSGDDGGGVRVGGDDGSKDGEAGEGSDGSEGGGTCCTRSEGKGTCGGSSGMNVGKGRTGDGGSDFIDFKSWRCLQV